MADRELHRSHRRPAHHRRLGRRHGDLVQHQRALPGSTTYATFSPTAAGRYYDMDVKTLVDRWWKSEVPNYGMVLTTTRDPTGR
jgi:hypothetical protein